MAEPTTTTRRPARCSKHAFAPRASWRPKNDVTGNVTLPAHRHQTCLDRAGLASETAGAGDDPVNNSDPTGLASAGTICGQYGSGSSQCAAAQQLSKRVVSGELANDAASDPCVHIIDIAGAIENWAITNRTQLIAGVGLVAGTAALLIPGAEPLGGEIDADSIAALTGSEAEAEVPTSTQVIKTIAGGLGVGADSYSCLTSHSLESCGAAILGGYGLGVPGDILDPIVAWILSASRYVSTGGDS